MRKTLKVLLIIDLILALIGLLLYVATNNSNDFSSLIVVFPMIGFAGVSVLIIVLSFLSALKGSANTNVTARQLFFKLIVLLGIPSLAIFYSLNGENRHSLTVVSIIAFIIGLVASIFMIIRHLQLKP